MKITYTDPHWMATAVFTRGRELRSRGWVWNGHVSAWVTTSREAVRDFVRECDEKAQQALSFSHFQSTPAADAPRLFMDNHLFILKVSISDRDIPRNHRFQWDMVKKRWFTPNPFTAYALKEYGDAQTVEILERLGKPRLRLVDGEFVFVGPYELASVARECGMKWHPGDRVWKSMDGQKLLTLLPFADPLTAEAIRNSQEQVEKTVQASRATEANVVLPARPGKTYLPFQKAGIDFALKRGNTLIADEPGLGKTIQAIGVLNALRNWTRTLVVVPANLKINWQRELSEWLVGQNTIGLASGKCFPETDLVVVNFDILKRHESKLKERIWDCLIVDEAHYCKNPKSKRTEIMAGIRASRKLFLTGTPILNRPVELYPLLVMIDSRRWENFFAYGKRYCGAKKIWNGSRDVWDFTGSSNLEELQETLRSTCMIRRLKKDVLTDLPLKRRQVLEIPGEAFQSYLENEKITVEINLKRVEELSIRVELAKASDNPEDFRSAVSKLKEAEQIQFEEISRVRHRTAVAKVPAVRSMIEEILESESKLIVFAHHTDVIEMIVREFPDIAVQLTGKMTSSEKQQSVDRFVEDQKTKIFVGSIYAAGVGLTLTVASRVLFAELDWVPGILSQAEDRAHRISQRHSVWVQHLVIEGSIDAKMAKTVVAKQEIIDRALDRHPEKKEKIETIIHAPVSNKSKACTAAITPSAIDLMASRLSTIEINDIHHQLKTLAACCDGAAKQDGRGFNKIDAEIGRSLARQQTLSPKQAALGQRILKKYRLQLGK